MSFNKSGVTDNRWAAYTGSVSAVESWSARRPAKEIPRPTFASAAQAHLDDVYRYLLYMTKDGTLAEDLTADTFERALRLWPRFDPSRAAVRTWLCQLARTAALDHFRAERRRRGREERYAREREPEASELAPGLSPELERGLAALSAAEREVIALSVVLELDGPAAAHVLGISQSACSTRLSRALEHLRGEMTIDE